MTIGERIKNRRIEMGLTQTELAQKIGFKTKTAICKIETDDRELRQSKIKPIAEALDTTVEYIMGWTDEEPKPTMNKEQREIIEGYDRLSEADKKLVRDMIKTLSK